MESIPIGQYLPSVLIVDDQALIRSSLRSALESRARVIEAEDGDLALEILQTRPKMIDLVLVEYVLPKRSGLEVLEVTKRCWPWIPVVLITGFRSENFPIPTRPKGAGDYLRESTSLEALVQTVGVLMTAGARARVKASADHPNIRRALTFIIDHFAETITLDDAARTAGLSRYHFSRLFHQETGLTFREYLRNLRVRQAKVLLADRHRRISEVAYTVGFNDLSHFDRTFRRMVGRSPREYRTSLKSA
jgi:two-component system response regulator YesN